MHLCRFRFALVSHANRNVVPDSRAKGDFLKRLTFACAHNNAAAGGLNLKVG